MRLSFHQIPWKKRLVQTVWILLGMGTMVLLGAAMAKKQQKCCSGIQVEIAGAGEHMFLDEKDILLLMTDQRGVAIVGSPIGKINLRYLEQLVEKNPWIRQAEMYFDNQQALHVNILERQPVARVFVRGGGSFYVDSTGLRLPLSEKLSVRVPVFTDFPSDRPVLARPDSVVLNEIVRIARFIQADSFWMAQIAQIGINGPANFELIPLIGDHRIILGDAEDLDQKFRRLYAFYQQAWLQQGMNTYEKLDLRFSGQVVGIRSDKRPVLQDSAMLKIQKPLVVTDNKSNNNPLTKGHIK